MNKLKIFCVIVIYNSKVSESVTFNNIVNVDMKNCYLIVVDNSVTDKIKNENSAFCSIKERCYYVDSGGNVGLSKGLNIGIDYVYENFAIMDQDLIIQLNDDTEVNEKYFFLLQERAEQDKDIDIFAPIIQGQDGVYYSPAYNNFFKHKHIKTTQDNIPQKRFMCIASGTAARKKVFDDYRFDEQIFMDLIDNNFCDDQRSFGRKFEKLNIVIQQNFALKNADLTYERIQKRYRIWIPDFLMYCKKKPERLLAYIPAVAARGIMLSGQCKNPRFFFWCVGYSVKMLFTRGCKR